MGLSDPGGEFAERQAFQAMLFEHLKAILLMDAFGPHALFAYTIVVLTFFVAYTLARIRARDAVPTEKRRMRFRSLLRTATFFSKLATPPNEKDGG